MFEATSFPSLNTLIELPFVFGSVAQLHLKSCVFLSVITFLPGVIELLQRSRPMDLAGVAGKVKALFQTLTNGPMKSELVMCLW